MAQESSKATKGKPRQVRLSDEEKKKIEAMASPQAMPTDERKRQYSAVRRAIAKTCEPSLLAKFSLCPDSERRLSQSCHACMAQCVCMVFS